MARPGRKAVKRSCARPKGQSEGEIPEADDAGHRIEWRRCRSLMRSHDELRAALIVAGREIRKLNFGKKDSPVLQKLREVLKEARVVARAERDKMGD